MLTEGGSQPADRLEYGFRLTTARKPTPTELEILHTVYAQQLARFTQDSAAAEQLLAVGETPRNTSLPVADHAAYTMTANLLLNLDEAITKE
jgi:hypothetical protein